MGVLGSLIANCTVLPLSLALPLWAAPVPARFCPPQQASLPTSSRLFCPPLFTSSRLSAFYICAVCVLGKKKILALTRRVKLGWGWLLVQNGVLTA